MIPKSRQHLIAYALEKFPDLSVGTILIAIEMATTISEIDLADLCNRGVCLNE